MSHQDGSRALNRRDMLRMGRIAVGGAMAASLQVSATAKPADSSAAVEQAHLEIWRRFIDKHGIMIDFTALDSSVSIPTPEECRAGKPNALGWWSPIENGAMFNGLYMDAAVNRWRHTKSQEAAVKARRLMEGLILLASISDVKGFIGRGVSTDGRAHYPMGSDDQTLPWFYGLWRYFESGLATKSERQRIAGKLTTTADVIVGLNWAMPAEAPFGTRGNFRGFSLKGAARMLFVCKTLFAVTGDPKWDRLYRQALVEQGGPNNLTRLAVCERGLRVEDGRLDFWTSCSDVASIRGLWEMEKNEVQKAALARGLESSASLALKGLALARQFDHNDESTFNPDWRSMNAAWKPQRSEEEAQALAILQLKEFLKTSPRRRKETAYVREPTSAAWIVTLAPDAAALKRRAASIEEVITHYDYSRLHYSQFFWVESAWWRLQQIRS